MTSEPLQKPVLFLVFNRPDLTQRVFSRIRDARPRRLFIAADGFRKDRPEEEETCRQTRLVTELIDWDCEVQRLYRDENLGCKVAVSGAISWFFDHVEEGIILEDDCLPDPLFFTFCSELLERYRDSGEVMQIGGTNFQGGRKAGNGSYYFSRYPHIWGWATWRRVWDGYDPEMTHWPARRDTVMARQLTRRARKMISTTFDGVKAGEIDTWDYQLVFQLLSMGGLAINPQCNLVENIGFDERATHTKGGESPARITVQPGGIFPLLHPDARIPDDTADLHTEIHVLAPKRPLLARLAGRIRRFFKVRKDPDANAGNPKSK